MKTTTKYITSILILCTTFFSTICLGNNEIKIFDAKNSKNLKTCISPSFKSDDLSVIIKKVSEISSTYIFTIVDRYENTKVKGVFNDLENLEIRDGVYRAKINLNGLLELFFKRSQKTLKMCEKSQNSKLGVGGGISGTVTSSNTGQPVSDGYVVICQVSQRC